MKPPKGAACLFIFGTVCAPVVAGSTIVSVENSSYGLPFGGRQPDLASLAVSWTISEAYSDVSISVYVAGYNSYYSTMAYLTNRIGLDTTSANEVAQTEVGMYNPHWLSVFSGISLGPGTYYLILGTPSNWDSRAYGGWFGVMPEGAAVYVAPTATLGDSYFSNGQDYNYVYLPASTFTPTGLYLDFRVEGTAVGEAALPEPSSGWLCLMGALAWWCLAVLRQRGLVGKARCQRA